MPKLSKNDLLKVKTDEQLARALFPETEGYRYKKERGDRGEIIVIIDDAGLEAHILATPTRPPKVEYTKDGDWGANVDFKFVFQPGQHLLLLGKEINTMGKSRYRHVRVDWNSEGLTKSFLQTLSKLDFGEYAAFQDLFDRREVTNRFYDEFIAEIDSLAAAVSGIQSTVEARQFAFSVAERLLFLYFVQTKGILDRRKTYVADLVKRFPTKTYESALRPLFFDCLNKEGPIRKPPFGDIPYLNGGLFRRTSIEEKSPKATIADKSLHRFVDFLGKWNWQLDERADVDTPDTLDPALLGHIFEKTVNQKDAGAYYTPRYIALYMAEQGILGYLGSRLAPPCRPSELGARIERMDSDALVAFARDVLRDVSVLDNACGSGAFLLAGLDVLADIWDHVFKVGGLSLQNDLGALFELTGEPVKARKYHLTQWLVARNIYGTDIEAGAVEIAKLRLWLALITHAPDSPASVKPLPNIDYNLRAGNALVGFTHWPQQISTLASLGTDCTDLARHLPANSGFDGPISKKWAQDDLLIPAIRVRQGLVRKFRGVSNAKEAAAYKRIIDAFDNRVRPQVNELWEMDLAKKVTDGDWWASFRKLRDSHILPFHWWYEFPAMMEGGGPSVIISNPPWETVVARRKEFLANVVGIDTTNKRKKEIDRLHTNVLKENPGLVPAWKAYETAVEVQRDLYHLTFKLQKGVKPDGTTASGDLNYYKLFFERWFDLQSSHCYSVIVPSSLYTDVSANTVLENVWAQADALLGLRKMSDHFDGVGANYRCCIVTAGPWHGKAPRVAFKVKDLRAGIEELFEWPTPFNKREGVFEVTCKAEFEVIQKLRALPTLLSQYPIELSDDLHTTGNLADFGEEFKGFPVIQGGNIEAFNQDFVAPTEFYKRKAHPVAPYERILLRRAGIAPNADVRSMKACLMKDALAKDSCFAEQPPYLSEDERRVLLALLNSFLLDYQVRAISGTNISKGNFAKLCAPRLDEKQRDRIIALTNILNKRFANSSDRLSYAQDADWAEIDCILFEAARLKAAEVAVLLAQFPEMRRQNPAQMALLEKMFAERSR